MIIEKREDREENLRGWLETRLMFSRTSDRPANGPMIEPTWTESLMLAEGETERTRETARGRKKESVNRFSTGSRVGKGFGRVVGGGKGVVAASKDGGVLVYLSDTVELAGERRHNGAEQGQTEEARRGWARGWIDRRGENSERGLRLVAASHERKQERKIAGPTIKY